MKISRRSLLGGAGASLAGLAASGPLSRALADDAAADAPSVFTPEPTRVKVDDGDTIDLFASRIGKARVGYGLEPGAPTIPGPTIEMDEGSTISVRLTNENTSPVSFHPHGVDYSVDSDGTGFNLSGVKPGASYTYELRSHAPSVRGDGTVDPGSAGYWHYHDHVMGTPHGTGGIKAGLFGALIVRRAGDPLPESDPIVLVMQGNSFNLKKAPKTPMPKVKLGERVEFVVITHGELFHTFHLHGHRWVDTRTGVASSIEDTARLIDTKTAGPADSFGFQVIAGEGVGEGAWMYHCHVQAHSDMGMSGLFVVGDAAGNISDATMAAIARWKKSERAHHH